MRTKLLFILLALVFLATGLMLSLSGCNGGTSQPSSIADPVAADTTELAAEETEASTIAPDVEEPASTVTELPSPEESEFASEPVIEDPVEQPILSWARDAGGLSHCDRLSIYGDGRVEAVACRATTVESTAHGTLSAEQLAHVLAWAAEYASFTRREMEISRAVRTTALHGSGEAIPELETKVEIAAFAADIFLGLTETE